MKHVHLLIKPASGACNLRCRYCFYADETIHREEAYRGVMSAETLETVVKKALDYAEESCTFAFQGGEPTLCGLPFFQKFIELEEKYNTRRIRISNAIQTNGILLDDAWAEFLHNNRFLVGISLDGTKDLHNLYRCDAGGKETHSTVIKTIRLLERHKVDFNILTVVTAQLAKHPREVFQFYKKNGWLYQQYIPCLDPLGERGEERYSLTPELFGKFMCSLFDLWYEEIRSGRFIFIRTFENYVGMLRGAPPESCGMSGICGIQNVIEADGTVYPCDYYVLDDYCIGDLLTDDFSVIEQNRTESGFIEASAKPHPDCLSCRWYRLCRGGCRRDRAVNEDGTVGKNYFCEGYKMFFSYAADRLIRLARG